MIEKVISGGQSGVDQAALRAARAAGISTGGYAPKGWLTDDGPAPWLADYGLVEHDSDDYRLRTLANVRFARFVVLVYADGQAFSPGTRLTRNAAREYGVECFEVPFYGAEVLRCGELRCGACADSLRRVRPATLMIAGNRESKAPGIGEAAEAFLNFLFHMLKE